MIKKKYTLIILGSGPAGYTASVYAARANLKPVIISGIEPGGQLMTTTDVDNWPGEYKGIQGPVLVDNLKKQSEKFNTKIIYDHIIRVNLEKKPFTLNSENYTYECDALIIATGTSTKYLKIPSEKKFMGKGVSYCATCDGFFYKNKQVLIIGGGNTAIEEALYLSRIVKNVTIIHRRKSFKAEKILIEKLMQKINNSNIYIKWPYILKEIKGNDKDVTGAVIQNTESKIFENIFTDGIFIAIGRTPNTQIFKNQLLMKNNYIAINGRLEGNFTATNIQGVYAAGDVVDYIYQQAVTASSSGCMAALDAEKYLDTVA